MKVLKIAGSDSKTLVFLDVPKRLRVPSELGLKGISDKSDVESRISKCSLACLLESVWVLGMTTSLCGS